jgi:PAS domain S-box-containing protein
MLTRLYRLIMPIFEDEDRLRLAGLLRAIAWALGVMASVYLVLAVGLRAFQPGAVLAVGILVLALVVYWLTAARFIQSASIVLVSALWLTVTVPVLVSPGQATFNFSLTGYVLPVLLAGILFSGRVSIALAIFSSLSGFVLLLTLFANGQALNLLESPVLNWAVESATFFVTAILLTIANRSIHDALDRARSGERNLTERNRQLIQEIAVRGQIENELKTQQDTLQQFQQRLKVLYEVSIDLAKITNLEEFCRAAVELGRSRLGFDRTGLFLNNEAANTVVGTFGTDQYGQTTDERSNQVSLDKLAWTKIGVDWANEHHIYVEHETELYSGSERVGRGWRVMVAMWSGGKVLGWMSVDNLLHQKPLLDYEMEILTLYGSMLGNLYVQKKSEDELLHSQEQLRLALIAARMRTWDWNIITDEIVRYGSGTWMPPYPTYQEFLQHVHPEDRDRIWQVVQAAIAGDGIYSAEYRFENPITGWGWLYTIGQVYRDTAGKVIGMVGVSQDITERKQAEEDLKRSEERFYKAFHATPSAISITTVSEGRIVDANESWLKLFGFSREECIGKLGADLNIWANPDDTRKVVDQFAAEGALHGVEVVRRTKSGAEIHALLYSEKINIAGEGHYLTMMEDLTERKAAEKQALDLALAKERVELLREFVGNISHDLKTPLTVINNSLYLLERISNPAKQKEKLGLIKMQTQVLDHYIQDILTISRLDYAPQIAHRRIQIETTLQNIERRLRPSIERNGLAVDMNLAPYLPPIWGDENELDRALVNLVENALNYTPAGGHISIRAYVHDEGVVIEVSDTGIGMSEADIPHIFERFYRSD